MPKLEALATSDNLMMNKKMRLTDPSGKLNVPDDEAAVQCA
jgi:hypothetical protein